MHLGYRRNTILHYAAHSGSLKLIGSLMDEGCDPNEINGLTESPLHILCKTYQMYGNHGVDVAKRLLAAGASLNARTAWGDTPAHYAGLWSAPQLLEFLLDSGAEVHKSKEVCIHPAFYARNAVEQEEQVRYGVVIHYRTEVTFHKKSHTYKS